MSARGKVNQEDKFTRDLVRRLGRGLRHSGGIVNATSTGDVSGPGSATDDGIALFDGTGGKTLKDSGQTIAAVIAAAVALAGDVVGPASAGNNNVPVFDGTTGKLLKDSSTTIAAIIVAAIAASGDVVGPGSSVDDRVALFSGVTGKLIKDGGQTLTEVIAAAAAAAPQGDVVGPASAVADSFAFFNGTTGKLITDGGGYTLTDLANDIDTVVAAAFAGYQFGNTDLKLEDTGADHVLTLQVNENLSANRVLQLLVGDGTRVLTLNRDLTINTGATGYTPTWSSTGTAPTLADGSLSGAFYSVGALRLATINLTWGASTNGGTGTWLFSLPATFGSPVSTGRAYDATTGLSTLLVALQASGTQVFAIGNGTAGFSATVPFAWANTDALNIAIVSVG